MKQEGRAGEDRKAGLMRIRIPPLLIFAEKEFARPELGPSGYLAMPRRYNHAIIILYGDGDPQVTVRVTRGSRTVAVNGAEFKVVPAAEEEVNIEFINTDPLSPRRGPTLEIISLRWREA